MKTATFITGASGGLGSSCVEMALNLDTDFVIASDLSCPNFENEKVISFALDVTSEPQIKEIERELTQRNITVKYLINNAGIFDFFPISEATEGQLNRIFKVNTFGPILCTSVFKNHLAKTKGKVIQISSVSVKLPVLFMPYQNSKIALEAFSISMRQELKILGIDLIIIRPGAMQTELISNVDEREVSNSESSYQNEFKKFTQLAKNDVGKTVHPRQVAQLIEKAIKSKKSRLIYSINKNRKVGLLLMFPQKMRDWLIVKQVK